MSQTKSINIEVKRQLSIGMTEEGSIVILDEVNNLLACREYDCDEHLGADLKKHLAAPIDASAITAKLRKPRRTDSDLAQDIQSRGWVDIAVLGKELSVSKKRLKKVCDQMVENGFLRRHGTNDDVFVKNQMELDNNDN